MSRGFGGIARMIMQDEDTIIYEYATYNLNDENYRNPQSIFDGEITLDKHSLVEPEIHEKLKKQPSGRKKMITKRIPRSVDYESLINSKAIQVINSKFCWEIFKNGFGMIAMFLIYKIYDDYQSLGKVPEIVEINV